MIDSWPHVSIVIPAKNEERDLGRCLASLQALDYPSDRVDITLVDNGSTDRTRDIAAEFGVRVLGDDTATIAGLRNLGSKTAQGSILGFLDADMEVGEKWLVEAVAAFQDPDVGAVGGLLGICSEPTWVEQTWAENKVGRPDHCEVRWLGSGNFLVRREVFDRIGGWDATLTTCEDLDICERIKLRNKLLFVAKVYAVHHGSSKTLAEVFRKEVWRGKNNFQRRISTRNLLRELPSLVFPIIHGVFLAVLFGVLLFARAWIGPALLLAIAFPALRALRVTLRTRHWAYFPRHFIIWFIYYTARSIAPLQGR